eukprot:6480446-Amphidinium_carterae.2
MLVEQASRSSQSLWNKIGIALQVSGYWRARVAQYLESAPKLVMHKPTLNRHLKRLQGIGQPSKEAIASCFESLDALPSLRAAIGKEADELDALTLEKGKELCQAIVQNHGQDVRLASDASGLLIDMQ